MLWLIFTAGHNSQQPSQTMWQSHPSLAVAFLILDLPGRVPGIWLSAFFHHVAASGCSKAVCRGMNTLRAECVQPVDPGFCVMYVLYSDATRADMTYSLLFLLSAIA